MNSVKKLLLILKSDILDIFLDIIHFSGSDSYRNKQICIELKTGGALISNWMTLNNKSLFTNIKSSSQEGTRRCFYFEGSCPLRTILYSFSLKNDLLDLEKQK